MRAPDLYRGLTDGDREPGDWERDGAAPPRRDELKTAASQQPQPAAPSVRPTPNPTPRPSGDLLARLDPERATRIARIEALDDMARSGKIDWAEWAKRVRDVYNPPPAGAKTDDLANARAAAADARAQEQAERARQRGDERER